MQSECNYKLVFGLIKIIPWKNETILELLELGVVLKS